MLVDVTFNPHDEEHFISRGAYRDPLLQQLRLRRPGSEIFATIDRFSGEVLSCVLQLCTHNKRKAFASLKNAHEFCGRGVSPQ